MNEKTAMQLSAVYACVRVIAETVASLPLHLYRHIDEGKRRETTHPLYPLLHDVPNPEMTSFIFREATMTHLLLWGNSFSQIIRNGRGEVSISFVVHTIRPWLVRLEQAMNKALLTLDEKQDYFIEFNVDGLLRGDYESRMNGYATARQNGWMSANDIRRLENMNLIPTEEGGDLYLINGNMTKLKDAGIFAGTGGVNDEKVLVFS